MVLCPGVCQIEQVVVMVPCKALHPVCQEGPAGSPDRLRKGFGIERIHCAIGIEVCVAPLVQTCERVGAPVDSVEIAVVVNGDGKQHLIRCPVALVIVNFNGQAILVLQRAVGEIHGIDPVASVEHIHLSVGIVERHAVNGADCVAVVANLRFGVPLALRSNIEEPVVCGHVDIAVVVFRRQNFNIRGADLVRTGIVAFIGIGHICRVNLQPALPAATGLGGRCEAENASAEVLGLSAVDEGVCTLVTGVVRHQNVTLLTDGNVRQIDGNVRCLARLVFHGRVFDDAAATCAEHRRIGDIFIVGDINGKSSGVFVFADAADNWRRIVNGHAGGQVGTFADFAAGQKRNQLLAGGARVQTIVFGNRYNGNMDAVALFDAQTFDRAIDCKGLYRLRPVALVRVIERAGYQLGDAAGVQIVAFVIRNDKRHRTGVADYGERVLIELGVTADGFLPLRVAILDEIGVANLPVGLLRARILVDQSVGLDFAGIGRGGISVEVAGSADLVEHGRVRPVSVVAQHGDRMGHIAESALSVRNRLGEHIAFNISTIGIIFVKRLFHSGRQRDLHLHLGLAIGRHCDGVAFDGAEDQVCVIGRHGSVAVHIGGSRINGILLASQIIQDGLCIVCVRVAVQIQIAVKGGCRDKRLSVHNVRHIGGQLLRLQAQIVYAVFRDLILGEDQRIECKINRPVRQVVHRKAEAVTAGAVRIIAKLRLDLAVSIGHIGVCAHGDVALGADCVANISKARTLLQNRIIAAAGNVRNGLRCGHKQTVDQLAGGQARLFRQSVFADILRNQGCHTGNLGRGHGGAGHTDIGGARLVQTVDGIDVSAGSGDLGLHLQRAGNTPGAEAAHGVVSLVVVALSEIIRDIQRTCVVQNISVGIRYRRGVRLDRSAVILRDGNARSRRRNASEVHAEQAVSHIVVNNGAKSPGIDGVVALLCKADPAAGADGNLAIQRVANLRPVCLCPQAVNEDIFAVTGNSHNSRIAIRGILVIEDIIVSGLEICTGIAVIVHGSDGHRVGIGAGRADRVEAHIVRIEQTPVLGFFRPVAGVAGCDADERAMLGQAVHDVLVAVAPSCTGSTGTQRQVDGIAPEHNGVLNGSHIVGVIGSAVGVEYIHCNDLSVRCYTLHIDRIQCRGECSIAVRNIRVGSGDTGNMRAVTVAHIVVSHVVVTVGIVKAKGKLSVNVKRTRINFELADIKLGNLIHDLLLTQQVERRNVVIITHARLFGQQTDGVAPALFGERLVVGISAGIYDGNSAAGTRIAGCIGRCRTGHLRGSCHQRVISLGAGYHSRLITGFNDDIFHAVELQNGRDLPILHICGNDVRSKRQVPLNIKSAAAQHFRGDFLRHYGLLAHQTVTVADRAGILRNRLGLKPGVNCRRSFQNNGNADHIRVCIADTVIGCFRAVRRRNLFQITIDFTAVNFCKVQAGQCAFFCIDAWCHEGQQHRNSQND